MEDLPARAYPQEEPIGVSVPTDNAGEYLMPTGAPSAGETSIVPKPSQTPEQVSDPGVFLDGFLRHREALVIYARTLGARDPEDVVQTTFIKALMHRDTLYAQPDASLRNWLYKITYNAHADQYRKDSRHETVDPQVDSHLFDSPEANSFERSLITENLGRLLINALREHDSRTDRNTKFAHLAEQLLFNDMSPRDYGKTFNVTPGTVRSRLNRLRTHLTNIGFLELLHEEG